MSELPRLRMQIRQRAKFACEFCGVTEANVGGQLTLDHFQPKSKGGSDELKNLLYCCVRCNQYKQDYWPSQPNDPMIWNPLVEPAAAHFLEGEEGKLFPLTDTGSFTIERLRLNRFPLISYRKNRHKQEEEARLLEQYKALVQLLEQANQQLASQVAEQQKLLREQRSLIQFLLRRKK